MRKHTATGHDEAFLISRESGESGESGTSEELAGSIISKRSMRARATRDLMVPIGQLRITAASA